MHEILEGNVCVMKLGLIPLLYYKTAIPARGYLSHMLT